MIKSNIRFEDKGNRSEIRCDNDAMIWKSPITDFNTGSTVIVSESQRAVFYLNGECSEELGPGIHVLETCEIPFIRQIIEKLTNNRTEFQAELYYINCVEMANLRWGVGHISYRDIKGPVFEMGARGIYNIKASKPRKIIEKLNGIQAGITKDALEDRFRKLVASAVNNSIVSAMYDQQISIIDISRYRVKIAEAVQPEVERLFDEYGIAVTQFIIEDISVDKNDPNYKSLLDIEASEGLQDRQLRLERQRELMRADIAAGKMDISSEAMARKRQREGYTYHDEKRFDVLKSAVEHDGTAGSVSNQFLDMGIGLGMAGNVGRMFSNSFDNANGSFGGFFENNPKSRNDSKENDDIISCRKCGIKLVKNSKFCYNCGAMVEKDEMVKCPKCGEQVKSGKFCSSCGASLASSENCPNCGEKITPGAVFCSGCGHKIR